MRLCLSSVFLCALFGCADVEPYIPAGQEASLRIIASNPLHSYRARVTSELVRTNEQKCEVPCTMQVVAGNNQITITGYRQFYQQMILSPGLSTARIKERNYTQIIVGGTLALVGYLGLAGAGFAIKAYSDDQSLLIDMNRFAEADEKSALAIRSIITAGVFGGIGLLGSIVVLSAKKDRLVLEGATKSVDRYRPASRALAVSSATNPL